MEINILSLRNSINKAYLKVKPNRTRIETFKKNITNLFDQIKESESEEDTSTYETEIDRLVYELYGLTEEEIRIVEKS
jgi:peptidoglycan hydrolase CwlO-like protein